MRRRRTGFGLAISCWVALASCGGASQGTRDEDDRPHPELCGDGNQDGNETDIDCGGPDCEGCPEAASCRRHDDCRSAVCRAQTCQAPTCSDETLNGNETDIDCGGACAACRDGDGCRSGADCFSGVCTDGACSVPSCSDRVLNGGETDIDCGGPACSGCPDGTPCEGDTECASGFCSHSQIQSVCRAERCANRVKDGDESDVDCGGAFCDSPCEWGMLCLSGADCWADAPCLDGVCIQTCDNEDDCGAAGDCIDGRCIYCAVDGDCPDGEHCRSGQCYVSR